MTSKSTTISLIMQQISVTKTTNYDPRPYFIHNTLHFVISITVYVLDVILKLNSNQHRKLFCLSYFNKTTNYHECTKDD